MMETEFQLERETAAELRVLRNIEHMSARRSGEQQSTAASRASAAAAAAAGATRGGVTASRAAPSTTSSRTTTTRNANGNNTSTTTTTTTSSSSSSSSSNSRHGGFTPGATVHVQGVPHVGQMFQVAPLVAQAVATPPTQTAGLPANMAPAQTAGPTATRTRTGTGTTRTDASHLAMDPLD